MVPPFSGQLPFMQLQKHGSTYFSSLSFFRSKYGSTFWAVIVHVVTKHGSTSFHNFFECAQKHGSTFFWVVVIHALIKTWFHLFLQLVFVWHGSTFFWTVAASYVVANHGSTYYHKQVRLHEWELPRKRWNHILLHTKKLVKNRWNHVFVTAWMATVQKKVEPCSCTHKHHF